MAKLNISQAAKLYGKDWKTIKRHIKKGRVTQDKKGLIDTSELIRAYGEPKIHASPTPENGNTAMSDHASSKVEELFGQQISLLEQQVIDLREERDRLLGVIEKQTLILEDKRGNKNNPTPESKSPSKNKSLIVGGLITIISILLIVLAFTVPRIDKLYGFNLFPKMF